MTRTVSEWTRLPYRTFVRCTGSGFWPTIDNCPGWPNGTEGAWTRTIQHEGKKPFQVYYCDECHERQLRHESVQEMHADKGSSEPVWRALISDPDRTSLETTNRLLGLPRDTGLKGNGMTRYIVEVTVLHTQRYMVDTVSEEMRAIHMAEQYACGRPMMNVVKDELIDIKPHRANIVERLEEGT